MATSAMQDAMTETLTATDAARAIVEATRYEDALRHRTEGLTQMVWGIVTSAIFTCYGFASFLDPPTWVYATLWLPWIAAGLATTFALWRSAALSLATPGVAFGRGYLLRAVATSFACGLVFMVARPDGPLLPLAIVGALWVLVPATRLYGGTSLGRALWLTSGATVLAAAGAMAIVEAPIEVTGTASMVLPGLLPLSFGLYQTLRG